jgi:hypothetical protein
MPVVNIKGVGQAQFPDGMSVDDIRSFLRRKYAQRAIEGKSDILQPVENIAAPYEPTLVEKFGRGIGDALTSSGLISDNYGAQRIGRNVAAIGEFLPGVGDAAAGDEFGRALAKGDYVGAALSGAGAIPVLGDMAIFAGVLAKNADLGALRKAKILEDTGADRDKIWKETGWANDKGDWKFEISDRFDPFEGEGINTEGLEIAQGYGSASQGAVLNHPELYKNYPETIEIPVSDSGVIGGGSYSPNKNAIKVDMSGSETGKGLDNIESINLHELQHAIQGKEGFARGGSPDTASYFLKANKDDELRKYTGERYQASSALFDMGKYGTAEYLAKLDKISKSSNVKPSSVTGLSDWYEYSDQIRDRFGVMPKTVAKGRNNWLQSAAAFIKNKNMEDLDYYGKQLVNDAIDDPKKIRSEYKKAERQFKKHEKGFKEHSKTERHFKKLEGLSPMEKYQRLAGEAESRNVEKRRGWTPEQRRATPPWESLDVPESELIYRK